MPIKNNYPNIIADQPLLTSFTRPNKTPYTHSNITIRATICPEYLAFPIAVVQCADCGNIYKEKLPFRQDQEFDVQNYELKCDHCGKSEKISYHSNKE